MATTMTWSPMFPDKMFSLMNKRQQECLTPRKIFRAVTGSHYFVQRLKLDRKLDVHDGCVNTVCWNDDGNLLLSGSDDQHLVISNPFNGKVIAKISSGHRSNIFCAKFLPASMDREIVSCSGSGEIFYTDVDREDTYGTNRFDCHFGTTYKIAVVPNEAATFLSCGDDGTVRFFDLRVKTSCTKFNCEEDVVINLRDAVSAMAVDPIIPFQMAVGSADGIVRIYDRRMLKTKESGGSNQSLISRFQSPSCASEKRHYRITSLNYRPGSHDVLVNYSSENIYLFNTYDVGATQTYSTKAYLQGETSKTTNELNSTRMSGGSTDNPTSASGATAAGSDNGHDASGVYKPIKRLRLRGDWSDTGPDARPESEDPAPTNLIMQRMSDLLTRMLNSHSSERLGEGENPAGQPDPDAASQRERIPEPTTASSSEPTSAAAMLRSVMLSSAGRGAHSRAPMRRDNVVESERYSISSEGLVSPELSSQDYDSGDMTTGQSQPAPQSGGRTDNGGNTGEANKAGQIGANLDNSVEMTCDISAPVTISDKEDQSSPSRVVGDNAEKLSFHASSHVVEDANAIWRMDSGVMPSQDNNFMKEKNEAKGRAVDVDPTHGTASENQNPSTSSINQRKPNFASVSDTSKVHETFNKSLIEDAASHTVDPSSTSNSEETSLTEPDRSIPHKAKFAPDVMNTHGKVLKKEDILHSLLMPVRGQESTGSLTSSSSQPSASHSSFSEMAIAEGSSFDGTPSQQTLEDASRFFCDSGSHLCESLPDPCISDTSSVGGHSQSPGIIGHGHSHDRIAHMQDSPLLERDEIVGLTNSDKVEADERIAISSMEETTALPLSAAEAPHRLESQRGETTIQSIGFTEPLFSPKVASPKGKGVGKSSLGKGKTDHLQPPRIYSPHFKDLCSKSLEEKEKGRKVVEDKDNFNNLSIRTALQPGQSEYEKAQSTSNRIVEEATTAAKAVLLLDGSPRLSKARAFPAEAETDESLAKVIVIPEVDKPGPSLLGLREPASGSKSVRYAFPPNTSFWPYSDDDDDDDEDRKQAKRVNSDYTRRGRAASKIQEFFRKKRQAANRMNSLPQPRVLMKFAGHRNCRTMIKEANFYGDDYVMSGSDCGRILLWERLTGRMVMYLEADRHVVNCVQPNPVFPLIASSGIDYDIKVWAPLEEDCQFDEDVAEMIIRRNELMLVETRDTITVPAAFMLRVLASLSQIRTGRNSSSGQGQSNQDQSGQE